MSARATRTARLDRLAEKYAHVPEQERPRVAVFRGLAPGTDVWAMAEAQIGRPLRDGDLIYVVTQRKPGVQG